MPLDCITSEANVGASACKKFPQALAGFIKTPANFTITMVNALVAANWQAAIAAAPGVRIHLFPIAHAFENVSEEAVRASSNLGKEVQVRPGQYRFRISFRENLEVHKRMYSHLASGGRVFLIDLQGKLIGTSTDGGTTLKGFLLDNFAPEKIAFGTGDDVSTSPIYFSLAENTELDLQGQQIEFAAIKNSLIALTDVVLAQVGSGSATEFTFSVKSMLDNVGIVGLVQADFTFTAMSGLTDNGDGTYTVAGSGMASGNLTMDDPADLSIKGYEASNVLSVAIS